MRGFFRSLQLPETVSGLRILDVGSGASDFTAELLDRGADVYALDPRYGISGSELRRSATITLDSSQFDETTTKRKREVISRFMRSFEGDSLRYKASSATAIPFPDDHFDIVVSINAITAYLDRDLDVFRQAVQECLRVTKSGGSVQLFPYKEKDIGFSRRTDQLRIENQDKVFNALRRDPKLQFVFKRDSFDDMRTVIITKSANH